MKIFSTYDSLLIIGIVEKREEILMLKHLYLLISFMLYVPCLIGHGENVIFDFNGVLMGTDRATTLQYIGLTDIVSCMICLKKSPTQIYPYMTTRFFNILNLVFTSLRTFTGQE